jgi:hypothetical protein
MLNDRLQLNHFQVDDELQLQQQLHDQEHLKQREYLQKNPFKKSINYLGIGSIR